MSDDPNTKSSRPWLPIVIIVLAVIGGWALLNTGPTTERVEEERPPKMVKAITVRPGSHAISVTANGSVIPSQRVTVEPQVSGDVIELHPQLIPGGFIEAGETLFTIDPTLIKLDLLENEAEEARARVDQTEAERKWREGRRLSEERVIADTELASLESALRIAEAELQRILARKARNEELLRRHTIVAPFNAMVLRESVELGQRVSPGDATVTLVGTDEFRVQAALPVDQLKWIKIPNGNRSGAVAKVVMDTGEESHAEFSGNVLQLQGDLEETGRMAKILISVSDPMNRSGNHGRTPLLIGSYVRVEIDAGQLENVIAIDRPTLRANNRIWIVDANGLLQIRDAHIRWRRDETILIDPVIQPGERLVTSELRVALPGTRVTTQEEPSTTGAVAVAPAES